MYKQLITSYKPEHRDQCLDAAKAALAAGFTAIQLSWDGNDLETFELGAKLRSLTWAAGAALVVNNRLDLALALEADALHLGQSDMPADVARRLLPEHMQLGLTVGSLEELLEADHLPVDYYGVGAVYGSKTRNVAPIGLKALAAIVSHTSRPVVAIGGITRKEVPQVLAVGAVGFAVVGAVYDSPCKLTAAMRLIP